MARRLSWRLTVCSAVALVAAAPAAASAPGTFEATITEEFAFLGCESPPSPTADLCGTVKTHGFGKGTTETVITGFGPGPPGCFSDQHTTTLFFKRGGSLTVDIDGFLCPTDGSNFTFTGTYTVTGGTGEFAGATGSGTEIGARQDGPIVSDLSGTLELDEG